MIPCLLATLVLALAPQQESALAAVRAVELEPSPGTVVQHFRLDAPDAPAADLPLGILRFVSEPDAEGGLRVELELEVFDDGLRLIHTEQGTRAGRRLIFRELRERAGRTLFLEGSPEKGYESYELGGREVVRKPLDTSGELPLFLIEAARRGRTLPRKLAVFDPLAARFEAAELAQGGASEERTLELRRADGSLRWRVAFRGDRPVEWRWQERGPVARAVTPEEYERVRAERDRRAHAAAEAAAALRPGPAAR